LDGTKLIAYLSGVGKRVKDSLDRTINQGRSFTFGFTLPPVRDLLTKETIIVVALVLAWSFAWSYGSTTILEWLPKLRTAQLKVHQLLFESDSRKSHVKWVTVVEVDDDTFSQPPFSGFSPTNRRALGELALKAAEQDPAVVAFDFRLWLQMSMGSKSADPGRAEDNRFLLEAICQITSKGIPVVITTFLPKNPKGEGQRLPNIFEDSELPPGCFVGHINMPIDMRMIAMEMNAWDWTHTQRTDVQSFALQVVTAYETALGIRPKTVEDDTIKDSARRNEWVFGGFFEPTAFPRVSGRKLWAGDKDAINACRHRIVLIGGTWHTSPGILIDGSQTPLGYVPNLYLHANYVEALLDNRYKASVPKWLMLIIDFLLSMLIYLSAHSVRQISKRIGVLAAFLLPLLLGYIVFQNAGRYLDFLVPLSLCFVDLARQTVKLRRL